MNNNSPSVRLLKELDSCAQGKGLPLSPRAKGYRYCMSQGFIERLGVPGILEVTRLTAKGRKFITTLSATKENEDEG